MFKPKQRLPSMDATVAWPYSWIQVNPLVYGLWTQQHNLLVYSWSQCVVLCSRLPVSFRISTQVLNKYDGFIKMCLNMNFTRWVFAVWHFLSFPAFNLTSRLAGAVFIFCTSLLKEDLLHWVQGPSSSTSPEHLPSPALALHPAVGVGSPFVTVLLLLVNE